MFQPAATMFIFKRILIISCMTFWASLCVAQQAMPPEDRRVLRQQMREQWQSQGEYQSEYRREETRHYREEGSWRQLPAEDRRQIRESMREQSSYRAYDRENDRHVHRRKTYPENERENLPPPRW